MSHKTNTVSHQRDAGSQEISSIRMRNNVIWNREPKEMQKDQLEDGCGVLGEFHYASAPDLVSGGPIRNVVEPDRNFPNLSPLSHAPCFPPRRTRPLFAKARCVAGLLTSIKFGWF